MDRINILVIDCQRNYFSGLPYCHREKVSMGKHAHTVAFRNCCRLFLRQNLSLSLMEVFCPCLKEKIYYFMKIKYFSQLCEQPHVNQFSHNFKGNEQIFDRLKLN